MLKKIVTMSSRSLSCKLSQMIFKKKEYMLIPNTYSSSSHLKETMQVAERFETVFRVGKTWGNIFSWYQTRAWNEHTRVVLT
jgi:hypothetical protein